MRRTCPLPRSTVLSPQLPSQLYPEAKGMRKLSESLAEGIGKSQESFWSLGKAWCRGDLGAELGEGICGLLAAPAPCLLTGSWHLVTSHRLCYGALQWAHWAESSCPVSHCTSTHLPSPWERTSKVGCATSRGLTVPNTSEPGLCKGPQSRELLVVFLREGVRQEVDFNFFLTRFRFIFFPSD